MSPTIEAEERVRQPKRARQRVRQLERRVRGAAERQGGGRRYAGKEISQPN